MSATSVNLTWESGSSATGFNLQRATSSNFSSGLVTLPPVGPNAKNYLDTSINAGTTYYYRFISANSPSSSLVSNTATALPKPTDTEIKKAFDAIANITVTYDPDNGIDNTAKVLALAELLYRSFYGSTIEEPQNGFTAAIYFLTSKDMTARFGAANGNTKMDNSTSIGIYLPSGASGLAVFGYLAHESGHSLSYRQWGCGLGEGCHVSGEPINSSEQSVVWHSAEESTAHINTVVFFKKLEELGTNYAPHLGNINTNINYIRSYLVGRIFDIPHKASYFDNNGQLLFNNTSIYTIGYSVEYYMTAVDPDFANLKAKVPNGPLSSADYVKLMNKLVNLPVQDLSKYLRSIIDSNKYDSVSAWYPDVLTSPTRLDGSVSTSVSDIALQTFFGQLYFAP